MMRPFRKAIAEFQKAFNISSGNPYARAFAVSGKREEAMRALERLRKLAERRYVASFENALTYTGLGDNDRSLEWLEKALTDRSWAVLFLKVDPRFEGLRPDLRFAGLLRRMGLQP